MNRTRKYLLPILKYYGVEFTVCINSLFKVAVGIGDIIVEKCGFRHEKHLFILVDTNINPSNFQKCLDWLREHPALEDDYVYGNVLTSRFHMLVITIPDEYLPTLQNFMQGKFSKMYSEKDLERFFTVKGKNPKDIDFYASVRKVLTHDHNYRVQFTEQIKKEFGVKDYSVNDLTEDAELDFPIMTREEFFNSKREQQDID